MRIGTKSLLVGVHQALIHPYYVAKAWRILYGRRPTWPELLAIITHDWGYWGSPDMDGEAGTQHPARMAAWWRRRGREDVAAEIEGHSRHYSALVGAEVSRLCWADKLSMVLTPSWLYLVLARASGELGEYMAASNGGERYTEMRRHKDPRRWLLEARAGITMEVLEATR